VISKRVYYFFVGFITLLPLLDYLCQPSPPVFDGWAMYAFPMPVCSVRTAEDAGLRLQRSWQSRPAGSPLVLQNQEQAIDFLFQTFCQTAQARPIQFALSCWSDGEWQERRQDLSCAR
jgi:hypothetical protein